MNIKGSGSPCSSSKAWIETFHVRGYTAQSQGSPCSSSKAWIETLQR